METNKHSRLLAIISLVLFLLGVLLCLFALAAEILGLDLTPGFGMVQMFQLLLGLSFLMGAGYLQMWSMRPRNTPRSLQADIGIRLSATGLIFAFVSGFSDLIGIGTHIEINNFERPYVGPLQLGGIVLGVLLITTGMILYYTSSRHQEQSSLSFILKNEGEKK
jgi:MFS family permease